MIFTTKDLTEEVFKNLLSESDKSELSKFMTHLSPSRNPFVWKSVHMNEMFIGSFWIESNGDKTFFGFFLCPSYRGQGLGHKLLSHILDLAKSKGIKDIYLNVRKENLNAIRIYEKFGFKPINFYFNKFNIPCIQYLKTDL